MNTAARHSGRRHRAHGFTLVELLVSLAIFAIVMTSAALLFASAVRTSKQGFQAQEAFEVARGVMDVVERDLSRAFTSREHGDDYSFYGTPIGFTYVGLISTEGSNTSNLARVTYVIYHNALDQLTGAVSAYDSVEGGTVHTYNLLRYVEPGVDNLDAYPIPWGGQVPSVELPFTLQDYVDQNVQLLGCPDAACDAQAERAFKSEIWIRMLAGGDPALGIPSAWDTLPAFVGDPANPNDDLRPEDFAIAENVRYLVGDGVTCDLENFEPDFDDLVFMYGNGNRCVLVLRDANDIPMFRPFDALTPATYKPDQGPIPFFTYWDIGVRRAAANPPTNKRYEPVALQFWDDNRNMVGDGINNDGDCLVGGEPSKCVDETDEMFSVNVGSPLDARLPIAVTVDFTLFYQSPYPGAPDFNRRFTQRIDIPTGYRRVLKTPAGGQ